MHPNRKMNIIASLFAKQHRKQMKNRQVRAKTVMADGT